MQMKWLAFIVFVYTIGMFLGSTFEYQTEANAGQDYTTGTAAFTNGSAVVAGTDTVWVAGMVGGIIKNNTDGVWYKILSIDAVNQLTLYKDYEETGGIAAAYTMRSAGWAGSGSAGLAQSPVTTLEYITNFDNVIQREPLLGGALPIPLPNGEYFDAVFKVFTWRFDFIWYDDLGRMFYWIVMAPFVVASVGSIIMLLYGMIFGNLTWN